MITDTEKLRMSYDSVSYRAIVNLFTLNKKKDAIELIGYDFRNKEHQWLFDRAISAAYLVNKQIKIDSNFFVRFIVWFKHRHQLKWIRRAAHAEDDKTVTEILDFMKDIAKVVTDDDEFNYDKITQFYRGDAK